MSRIRRALIVGSLPRDVPARHPVPASQRRARDAPAVIAIAFVVGLLILATTSQGAFAISRWAPLGLFAIAILIGAIAAGRRVSVSSRAALLALAGIWGSAIVSLASMLWAQSAADALQAGDEMILYAAIATLPFVLPLPRRALAAAGWAMIAGLGAVALYVLVGLLTHGSSLYLAGRLNAPIDYRNATALLFAIPVAPCIVAAAARGYRRPLRAAALGLSTLCLGLTFLTQSRGVLIGLAAGELVILALGPDRVRRALVSVIPVLAVVIASHWLLAPFHGFDGGDGVTTGHQIAVAALALALASLGTLTAGLLLALFDAGLRAESAAMRHLRRGARASLAIGAVALAALALVAMGNPATYAREKWDQFTSLSSSTPATTRLGTVNGQRYDLWRVAVREFESRPVLGVGAGNYQFDYYRWRATDRNLDDPHSLVFTLLSETGAVGLGLMVLFIAGILLAVGRSWRRLSADARRSAVAMLAAGMVLMGQSLVDWIWLIPGLTGVGVLALALAAAQATRRTSAQEPASSRRGWPAGLRRVTVAVGLRRVTVAAGLTAAVVALFALLLSNAYIQQARSLIYEPARELSAASAAQTLDPWSVTPLYLKASALESMGRRPAADAALHAALALEPANSATLGVIGDFEARGHHWALARAYYRRAYALDPRDTGLAELSRLGLPRR
jgi:tetratricopeptide (TPR) repeat protein